MFYRIRLPANLTEEERRKYVDQKLSSFFAWCIEMVKCNLPDNQCEIHELAGLTLLMRAAGDEKHWKGDIAYNCYLELGRTVSEGDRWKNIMRSEDVLWMEGIFIPNNLKVIEGYRNMANEQGTSR